MRTNIHNITFALMMLAMAYAPLANARSEFILFPEARLNYEITGVSHPPERNNVGTGIFYTYEGDRLQVLVEGVAYTDDQDIERLQAGWKIQPETTFWLGLYHNPLIYWNDLFHHGAYIQTSITRPAIALFEGDEGGALQTQLFGGLLESAVPIKSGMLHYSLALGTGTAVGSRRALDAMDFDREQSQHRLNTTLRFDYHVNANDENNEFGVVFNRNNVAAPLFPSSDIQQTASGVYLNWEWRRLRLLSAAYWLRNVINIAGQNTAATFSNGYLQLEYEAKPDWIIFGRIEGTQGGQNNAYLSMFPDFALERNTLGVRYDFMHLQALKLEIATAQYQDSHQRAIRLQWSGGVSIP